MLGRCASPGLLLILRIAHVARGLQLMVSCDKGFDIRVTSLCDGKADCVDGTDEKYVGTGFKCRMNGSKRSCVLPQELVRDTATYCDDMSDSCFDSNGNLDGRKCFQCLNGKQVVSVTQICDGIVDCNDLSDECLCLNNSLAKTTAASPICSQVCTASQSDPRTLSTDCGACSIGEVACSIETVSAVNDTSTRPRQCIGMSQVCDGVRDCPEGDDEQYCPREFRCEDNETFATACDGVATCPHFEDECDAGCWNKPGYCQYIANGTFTCSRNDSNVVHHDQVCDSVVDCQSSQLDEMFCSSSDHFYCWRGDILFANWSNRYDGVRQCEDGSDECQGTFYVKHRSLYEDDDRLVRNPYLTAVVFLLMVPALLGNAVVIVTTARELWNDRYVQTLGRLAKCNRTLVLHLAFADFLMGLYLLILAFKMLLTWNNYCVHDRAHRASRTCTAMGMLSQVSSQTSVFILLLMTSYRLYGTLHPFRIEESRLIGGATTLAALSWLTSLGLSFIPQIPYFYDYFVSNYWLPLAFVHFDRVKKEEMKKIVLSIQALTANTSTSNINLTNTRWDTMINYVISHKFAALDPRWNEQHVVPTGYYNRYPTCQPFYYAKVDETAWLYMTTIIAFNFLAFVYIATAYVVIYRASSRPCVRKSVRRRTKQWRQDNRTMQKKILCLVATDMVCWMPVCIISLLRLCGVEVHLIVHGLTGILLLPINSAVNPLIYSNAISNLRLKIGKKTYNDSNSSDASDAARLIYSGRLSSGQSCDSSPLTLQQSNGSAGNLSLSPHGQRKRILRNNSSAMRKKLSNGFVTHVQFMDSQTDVNKVDDPAEKRHRKSQDENYSKTRYSECCSFDINNFILDPDLKETAL